MDSWMFDKQVQVNVCLTGQFALLMLIEELELNGIPVFMFNTDGITLQLSNSKKEIFEKICEDWQAKTKFILERVDYKKMIFSTVNDYLAIKTDGTYKVKGDYISDYELWKNKSWRVVGMALQEYFVNGKNPVEFINNHENIFDFCLMTRATGGLYLEEQIKKEGEIEIIKHKKLIRYYLCKNSGSQLFKRGIGTTGKNTNISLHADNELGEIEIKYFNKYEKKPFKEYNVDKAQYIFKCLKIIDKIERTNKAKSFIESTKPQKQMSLF